VNLLRSMLFDNLGLKLVALLLAVVVYLNVYTDRPATMMITFPIQITDLPDTLSLYGPAALSPDKLATTLARLFALLGPDRVGSPRPVDGHRPERFSLVEYTPPAPPEIRREPRAGRGLLAVRCASSAPLVGDRRSDRPRARDRRRSARGR